MGSLTAAECDRAVAAIDLAERERLPVDWVPISAGARIAMDSGTENLDATARVARRIITFTERGGVIHVVVYGVNVGAQSYWNALATMVGRGRGVLIMTPDASMVLTGVGALAASGGVSAEDEVALGGFERIMGPNGEAQYYAPDLPAALRTLADHYRYTYVVPGRAGAPPPDTTDPPTRDVTASPYQGDATHGFATIGEIFDDATNPGRKRAVRHARGHAGAGRPGRRAPRALALLGRRRDDDRLRRAPGRHAGLPDRHREREPAARGLPPAGRARVVERRHALPAVVEEGGSRAERRRAATGRRSCWRTSPASTARPSRCGSSSSSTAPRSRAPSYASTARPVPRRLALSRRRLRRVLEVAEPAAPRHGAQRLLRRRSSAAARRGGRAHARGAGAGRMPTRVRAAPRGARRARRGDAGLRARARRTAMRTAQARWPAEFDAVHTVERACRVGSLDDIVEPRACGRRSSRRWKTPERRAEAPDGRLLVVEEVLERGERERVAGDGLDLRPRERPGHLAGASSASRPRATTRSVPPGATKRRSPSTARARAEGGSTCSV
jgi:hypothetical protein